MPENLGAFFTFLGTSAAIGGVLSFIAENWKFFQNQSAQGKMIILFIASFSMSAASYALITYAPAGLVTGAEPIYKLFVTALTILLSTQAYHGLAHQDSGGTNTAISIKQSTPSTSVDANAGPNSAVSKNNLPAGPAPSITINTAPPIDPDKTPVPGYVPVPGLEQTTVPAGDAG